MKIGSSFLASASIAAAFLTSVNSSEAINISVPGFSFESPSVAGRPFDFQDNGGLAAGSAIPEGVGWFYLGGFIQSGSPVGVQVSASSGMTAPPDGTQSLYLNNGSWVGSAILTTIAANTTYTLTLGEGNRGGFPQTDGFTIALAFGSTAGATGLTNSSQWLASAHYELVDSPAQGTWANMPAVVFTTGAADPQIGQSLFIVLGSDANTGSFAQQVNFDNVLLDATVVPEPATIALVMGGLALFAVRRRHV